MSILPVRSELFFATDGQTDRHDEADNRFRSANAPKNKLIE